MQNSTEIVRVPTIEASPRSALVDEPTQIQLKGFAPQQIVILRARTVDHAKKAWASYAVFQADAQGNIDLTTQKPLSGTYRDLDTTGLFWSMLPVDTKQTTPFIHKTQQPLVIELVAEVEGEVVASTQVTRLFVTPDVKRQPVRENGLVGTFFSPVGPGPHPAIIVLNGSDGGLRENPAALLASHGYAALALAYFNYEDLPRSLTDIPLEYFETAIAWLQAQEAVNAEKIAVIGLSRGGELALLLGSLFPAIKAVVSGAPSPFIQAGINETGRPSGPAWTFHDEPLPHVNVHVNFFIAITLCWQAFKHHAFAMRTMFLTTLKDRNNLERATIQVENIQGPVLLISGEDDQLWPSTLFAERIMDRLAQHQHPYPYEHLRYKGAGHFVCFPYGLPSLPPYVQPAPGIAFGGSIAANAHSVRDSWPKILAFLEKALR